MSDGHPGFGGFDLFMARLGSDGNWQEPKNLGSPINSKMDEGLMVVDFQGERAYFATDRPLNSQKKTGQYADYDLYTFELYPDIRPNRAVFVRGKVLDAQSKAPLQAKIQLYDLRTTGQAITKHTDTDGSFLFVLEDNREYGLFTQANGYLTTSINFNLVDYNEETQDGLEILLTPIATLETNKQNILENVFFESGKATLQAKSLLELDLLAALMLENDIKIKIIGHTDDVGEEMDNLALSHARAKAVVDYLVAKGIPESRLGYEGRGELEPIADNSTEEGRRANRRTTFLVLD
jgi:outer membrane protein OmpA-like peptidoglycan-associated protein